MTMFRHHALLLGCCLPVVAIAQGPKDADSRAPAEAPPAVARAILYVPDAPVRAQAPQVVHFNRFAQHLKEIQSPAAGAPAKTFRIRPLGPDSSGLIALEVVGLEDRQRARLLASQGARALLDALESIGQDRRQQQRRQLEARRTELSRQVSKLAAQRGKLLHSRAEDLLGPDMLQAERAALAEKEIEVRIDTRILRKRLEQAKKQIEAGPSLDPELAAARLTALSEQVEASQVALAELEALQERLARRASQAAQIQAEIDQLERRMGLLAQAQSAVSRQIDAVELHASGEQSRVEAILELP